MTLQKWYDYNFNVTPFKVDVDNIVVKVFRHKSCKNNDKLFEQRMKADDAIHVFGDFRLVHIESNFANGDYHTIEAFICKDE